MEVPPHDFGTPQMIGSESCSYFNSNTIRRIIPIGSMYAIYMVTFTINIPQMLAYIPYMDPMG